MASVNALAFQTAAVQAITELLHCNRPLDCSYQNSSILLTAPINTVLAHAMGHETGMCRMTERNKCKACTEKRWGLCVFLCDIQKEI